MRIEHGGFARATSRLNLERICGDNGFPRSLIAITRRALLEADLGITRLKQATGDTDIPSGRFQQMNPNTHIPTGVNKHADAPNLCGWLDRKTRMLGGRLLAGLSSLFV